MLFSLSFVRSHSFPNAVLDEGVSAPVRSNEQLGLFVTEPNFFFQLNPSPFLLYLNELEPEVVIQIRIWVKETLVVAARRLNRWLCCDTHCAVIDLVYSSTNRGRVGELT